MKTCVVYKALTKICKYSSASAFPILQEMNPEEVTGGVWTPEGLYIQDHAVPSEQLGHDPMPPASSEPMRSPDLQQPAGTHVPSPRPDINHPHPDGDQPGALQGPTGTDSSRADCGTMPATSQSVTDTRSNPKKPGAQAKRGPKASLEPAAGGMPVPKLKTKGGGGSGGKGPARRNILSLGGQRKAFPQTAQPMGPSRTEQPVSPQPPLQAPSLQPSHLQPSSLAPSPVQQQQSPPPHQPQQHLAHAASPIPTEQPPNAHGHGHSHAHAVSPTPPHQSPPNAAQPHSPQQHGPNPRPAASPLTGLLPAKHPQALISTFMGGHKPTAPKAAATKRRSKALSDDKKGKPATSTSTSFEPLPTTNPPAATAQAGNGGQVRGGSPLNRFLGNAAQMTAPSRPGSGPPKPHHAPSAAPTSPPGGEPTQGAIRSQTSNPNSGGNPPPPAQRYAAQAQAAAGGAAAMAGAPAAAVAVAPAAAGPLGGNRIPPSQQLRPTHPVHHPAMHPLQSFHQHQACPTTPPPFGASPPHLLPKHPSQMSLHPQPSGESHGAMPHIGIPHMGPANGSIRPGASGWPHPGMQPGLTGMFPPANFMHPRGPMPPMPQIHPMGPPQMGPMPPHGPGVVPGFPAGPGGGTGIQPPQRPKGVKPPPVPVTGRPQKPPQQLLQQQPRPQQQQQLPSAAANMAALGTGMPQSAADLVALIQGVQSLPADQRPDRLEVDLRLGTLNVYPNG